LIKNILKQYGLLLLIVALIGIPVPGNADSSIATNGKSAQTSVKFRVIIPQFLSMHVGTLGQKRSPFSLSSKDEIRTSRSTADQKRAWVKTFGLVGKKGTMQLSSTVSNWDETGLNQTEEQYLFTAGRISVSDQTKPSMNNDGPSLSTSQLGRYSLLLSNQNSRLQPQQSGSRFYILCSP